ncbi:MAG: methionyl-tRNA formyltransferase [Planctomycetota bacterium]
MSEPSALSVIFMGSPPFAAPVLDALLASPHRVLALVTPPDRPRGRGRVVVESPLVTLAKAAGLPVLQPETTKDPEFVATLAAFGADVLVVASYGELLRRDLLGLCPHGALNVHGSLLPRWRGASPIQRAVQHGDAETGVSIQRMVMALDAGDVLLERRTPIGPDETSGALFERLAPIGGEALVAALDQLAAGTATFTPQDPAHVTLAPKLVKADGALDWARPAEELARLVRAMQPWPGARTTLPDGRELELLRARAVALPAQPEGAPQPQAGALLADAAGRASTAVAAGAGALELIEVKPAGKGAMDAASFLRGARLAPGARFGVAPGAAAP